MRLRLIPLVIFAAALFLTVRMGGLWSQIDIEVGGASVAEQAPGKPIDLTSGMNAARGAPDKPRSEVAKEQPAKAGTKGDGAKAGAARTDVAKTDGAKAAPTNTGAAKPDAGRTEPAATGAAATTAEKSTSGKSAADATTEKSGASGAARSADGAAGAKVAADKGAGADSKAPGADAKAPAKAADGAGDSTPGRPMLPRKPLKDEALTDPDDMSRGDLKILQDLAQRRRELDQREHDLAMRDGLLKAAEKRVEEKIAELAAMKAKLEALVKQRADQQSVQLKSLVKIYENMKPKDAAQIFDQLDMTILVELLANMKEAKSAPIMAAMDPKRVKDVTARLINRKSLGSAADGPGRKTAAR